MRLADPQPNLCSVCGNSSDPGRRYVDFEVAYDGPVVIDPNTGTYRVEPNGAPSASEDFYACFACVRAAAEIADAKPQILRALQEENRRLKVENHHWREQARRLKDAHAEALDSHLGEPPMPRRRIPA